jgi:hypothetical protein
MKRFWWIPILCVAALAVPVVVFAGSQNGFDGAVGAIESRYHVPATRIPFLGVASLIAHKATNGGVSALHVAEFDNFPAQVDGEELNNLVEEKLGPGWERMIRETNRKGNEQTLIFIHPEGARMGMFVVDKDGNELDVVQISVDPDHLNQSIGKYQHQHGNGDVPD